MGSSYLQTLVAYPKKSHRIKMMKLVKTTVSAIKVIRKPHVPKTALDLLQQHQIVLLRGHPILIYLETSALVAQQNLVFLLGLVHPSIKPTPRM